MTEKTIKGYNCYPGLESREYGRKDPSRRPRDTLYPQKLALTSPIRGHLPVGIVPSLTQATDFFSFITAINFIQNCIHYPPPKVRSVHT
jgi:hypothetical protein